MDYSDFAKLKQHSHDLLEEWLESCTRGGKISRNTVSVGMVVLNHLRQKCPCARDEVVSQGGEIKGARSGLRDILGQYDISGKYLKEVTTRQGHQDGQRLFSLFKWGEIFVNITAKEREEILLDITNILTEKAKLWLLKQNLKLNLDRNQAPSAWINLIIENAKNRSNGFLVCS